MKFHSTFSIKIIFLLLVTRFVFTFRTQYFSPWNVFLFHKWLLEIWQLKLRPTCNTFYSLSELLVPLLVFTYSFSTFFSQNVLNVYYSSAHTNNIYRSNPWLYSSKLFNLMFGLKLFSKFPWISCKMKHNNVKNHKKSWILLANWQTSMFIIHRCWQNTQDYWYRDKELSSLIAQKTARLCYVSFPCLLQFPRDNTQMCLNKCLRTQWTEI